MSTLKRSKKLLSSARGEDCTLQIFPYCNQNPETTVACHINCGEKGIGTKSPDYFSVYGCSTCHDIIDGRRKTDLSKEELQRCTIAAIQRTMARRIDLGLMVIK